MKSLFCNFATYFVTCTDHFPLKCQHANGPPGTTKLIETYNVRLVILMCATLLGFVISLILNETK